MKSININGVFHSVPKWVNYIAMDDSGVICGYKNKPSPDDGIWCPDGQWEVICNVLDNWSDSLEKV